LVIFQIKPKNHLSYFFQKFKELVEEEIRMEEKVILVIIFVCDELKVQSEAVRFVFEDCKIIYCKHNLIKDIERNCNNKLYFDKSCIWYIK